MTSRINTPILQPSTPDYFTYGFYAPHVLLYQHWANSILCEVGIVVDAIEEFQNGALLAVLVDLLWADAQLQKKLQEEGLGEELNQETALQCTCCVLHYVQDQGVKISISAHDIIDGDVKSLLDLLWVLILHFTIHSPDVATHLRTVKCGKRKILDWCGQMLGGQTLDAGQSLAANLCSGGQITSLICQICEVPENPDPLDHLTNALLAAEEQLGISKHILDPFSTINGNAEDHSLLVYMALLRRKAQLIEDLAPHEKAPASAASGLPAGGMNQQWSSYPLPAEAVQAMGLDSGDYVMYAIVEEHFIPPEALEAFQGQFDMLPAGYNLPDKPSTVKISEIFSEDEAGSGHNSGAESPGSRWSPGPTVTVTQLSPRISTDGREDPVQAYFQDQEADRKQEKAVDPNLKFHKHREFPDAGGGDGRPINPVPWRIEASSSVPTNNANVSKGMPADIIDSESPMEEEQQMERHATRGTRMRQSSSDFSSDDRVQESIFEEIQKVEKGGKKKKKPPRTKPRAKTHDPEVQDTRKQEVEEALSKSESVRASIAEMLAGMSSLTGQDGADAHENMSDEDVVATMTAMRNLLSNQTDTGDGDRSRINDFEELDEAGFPRDRGKLSDSTDSLEAVRDGSAPASLNDSGDLFQSEDELLDLLDRIGQQGEDMRSELENAYAREVVLTHSKINEDDTMAEVINKLKNEIEQLRAERDMDTNHLRKRAEDMDTVVKLKKTISDLRGKLANLKSKKDSGTKTTPLMKSTGTLTDRLVAVHQAAQTVGSFFRMSSKSCQTARSSTTDRGLQTSIQPFTRSRFTSTADMNLSVVKINSCTQTNAITNADISYYEKQLLDMGHNSRNESSNRPKRVHKKMLDKMIQHISDIGMDPASQALLLEKLEGFESLAENVEKWQQLSMLPVNEDPILLHFQRSLACAAFENRLLQSELHDGPKNTDIMRIKHNMELATPYASKNMVNKLKGGNGVVPELDQLKERITSLEQTLTNAQVDNNKLTSKLEEALHTVKENIELNPQHMSSVERENQVLMKRLMKVETVRDQLEEGNNSLANEDLQRLQSSTMNSPDVVCGIENSLADIQTERQQLEAEVIALREEYDHIRRGMEHMGKYAPPQVIQEAASKATHSMRPIDIPTSEPTVSNRDTDEDARIKRLVELMEREFSHRDQRKRSSEDHLAETKVTKSKASEVRGRAPAKTAPTRAKDERSSQVQKELDKRFPRSRSNSNSSAPRSTSRGASNSRTGSKSRSPSASNRVKYGDKDMPPIPKKSTESASLVDRVEVRDMGIDELRKKRLAMLIESYTSHTSTDSLRKRMEGMETAGSVQQVADSPRSRLTSDMVLDDNVFDPMESSGGYRRKLPYIPRQSCDNLLSGENQSDCLSLPLINQKSDAEFTSLPISKDIADNNEHRPYFMRARRQQVSAKAGSQSRTSIHSTTDSGVSDVGSLERPGRDNKHASRDHSPNAPGSGPTQVKGPYLNRHNDLQKVPTPRSAWTGSAKSSKPNPKVAPSKASLEKAPWSKTKPTPQTQTSNHVSSRSPLEESDTVSTSSSVRELISSLNHEHTKPNGVEYSDGVFPSMDDTEESTADMPRRPASKKVGKDSTSSSRKDRSPSSSSKKKKLPQWKQAALSSAKRTEYSDSSTDKSDEYWKEYRRYDRYSRRGPDRTKSESPQRAAPWTSKPRSQEPLLASAPLPEISRVQPTNVSSLPSPRYLSSTMPNKSPSASSYRPSRDLPSPRVRDLPSPRTTPRDVPSPRVRDLPSPRTTPRDVPSPRVRDLPSPRTTPRDVPSPRDRASPCDPTLLDDPGNLRHYERAFTDASNLTEKNRDSKEFHSAFSRIYVRIPGPTTWTGAPVNLRNLSRTSDTIPTVGTYADTLINRYASPYSSFSSSSAGARHNQADPLFSNENDYVNHLLDKYSKSSWRK